VNEEALARVGPQRHNKQNYQKYLFHTNSTNNAFKTKTLLKCRRGSVCVVCKGMLKLHYSI